jgi:chromosome segregation ATPase
MKKQKRYETRESIVEAIDHLKATIHEREAQADLRDETNRLHRGALAKMNARTPEYFALVKEIETNKLEASNLRKKNNSTTERLRRMKNTLAAFDTEVLSFVGDKAVVLQGP